MSFHTFRKKEMTTGSAIHVHKVCFKKVESNVTVTVHTEGKYENRNNSICKNISQKLIY